MIGRAPGAGMGDTVALVVSPRAAAEQDTPPRELLQRAGLEVAEQLGVAEAAGDIYAAKRWRRGRYRAVVAAGGDGTVGTTAGLLMDTGIPLGILPVGTSNNVARALEIPFDLEAAAAAIAGGVSSAMDAGVVEIQPGGERDTGWWRRLRLPGGQWLASSAGSRCFLHAATLGLNVEFARLATDASRRAALGSLTYPAASLEALTHLQSIPVRLRLAGVPSRNTATGSPASRWQVTLSTEVLQLAVINTPLFGGTLHLSLPGVDAHDQLLDVFLVEPPNLEKGLETVRALMERLRAPWHWLKPSAERRQEKNNGRNADQEPQTVDVAGEMVFPGVRRYQAREVSIETASPVEMTLDGELFGRTPVRIRVAPARVAVLRPLPAAAPQS